MSKGKREKGFKSRELKKSQKNKKVLTKTKNFDIIINVKNKRKYKRKEVSTMTKKEMYNSIATMLSDNAEVVAFCAHEVELLEKKNSGKRGLTATQKANVEVKAVIANVLAEAGSPLTVTEALADSRLAGYTNQKVSALLKQMVDAHEVVKTIEGKKARFSVA